MRWLAAIGLTTALWVIGSGAQAIEWGVEMGSHRSWFISATGGPFLQSFSGDFTPDSSLGDTSLDESILGVDADLRWAGRIDLRFLEHHHLRLGITPIRFNSKATLDELIIVGGIPYPAGTTVTSLLKFDTYELAYSYEFFLGERFSVSPMLQVNLVDAKAEVDNIDTGFGQKGSLLAPIPMIGLRGEAYPISRLGLFAEGKGMTIGRMATAWEVEAGGSIFVLPGLALTGSYRLINYDFDYDDSKVKAGIGGPFFGLTTRF